MMWAHVRVDWFSDGDPRMDGAKNVEMAVAYTEPVSDALKKHAKSIAREAKAILEVHAGGSHDGKEKVPHSKIDTIHNHNGSDLDSYVTLEAAWGTDEAVGDYAAAASIEFGHYTRSRKRAGYGPLTKEQHGRVFVKGISPLRKAAHKLSSNPKLSI